MVLGGTPKTEIVDHSEGRLYDITGATDVEIMISKTGDRIWVNVSELECVLRICRINGVIQVNDGRT